MSKPRADSAPAARGDGRAPKRSASPSLFRRIAAATTALVLGAGLALVAVAAPASAHHNTIRGEAICSTDAKTVDITWTVENSEGIAETITSSSMPDVVANGTTIAPHGTPTFVQKGAALGTTHKLKLSAEWTNKNTQASTGEVKVSSGYCDDDKKLTICHATSSGSNPYVIETIARSAVVNAHIEHQHREDIIPAFTHKGVDYPAQGDQSRLTTGDCSVPAQMKLPIPTADFADECGVDNYALAYDPTLKGVTWNTVVAGGALTLVATAAEGFLFEDGRQSVTFGPWTLDETQCAEKIPAPTAAFVDECGVDNFVLSYDETLAGVVWSTVVDAGTVTLTATPTEGHEFENGEASVRFGPWDLNEQPCIEPSLEGSVPTVTGPEGSGDGGSTTAATSTGLASTGFAGTTIAIIAGVVVAAGIAFLVIARVRRKRP
jgi:hypothetical protein